MGIHCLTVAGALLVGDLMESDAVQTQGGAPVERQETRPGHVLVRVGRLQDELEHIRVYMGRPKNRQLPIDVKGVAPREVYFMALTLFRKADRLCFEHTRRRAEAQDLPKSDISPRDVDAMVDAAMDCVERVKSRYGIDKRSPPRELDLKKQPADVLRAIVQANRQLNLMLEQQFAPSDVFQQVTLGVGYSSRLLETFPGATRIPDEPMLEPDKRPADVYQRLLNCFRRIRRIAECSDLEMLELELEETKIEEVVPSDVYDIASLIVAELAYLHARLPESEPPRKIYFAGRKFPSHVFQRAGILDLQLLELEKYVEQNPDWLQHEQTEPCAR